MYVGSLMEAMFSRHCRRLSDIQPLLQDGFGVGALTAAGHLWHRGTVASTNRCNVIGSVWRNYCILARLWRHCCRLPVLYRHCGWHTTEGSAVGSVAGWLFYGSTLMETM